MIGLLAGTRTKSQEKKEPSTVDDRSARETSPVKAAFST